jgi:RNA polymerase sigma-70 factor, ECF subfamily
VPDQLSMASDGQRSANSVSCCGLHGESDGGDGVPDERGKWRTKLGVSKLGGNSLVASSDAGNQAVAERIAELWTAVSPAVAAYIRAEIRGRHDADDVLQEVGKSVVTSFEHYDSDRPFTNWIFGIARNQVLQYYRKRSKERTVFSSEFVEGLASAFDAMVPTLSARQEALRECLKRLKAKQMELIRMYYQEEVPLTEIAERLNSPQSTVYVTMHRTRTALKDCVNRRLQA